MSLLKLLLPKNRVEIPKGCRLLEFPTIPNHTYLFEGNIQIVRFHKGPQGVDGADLISVNPYNLLEKGLRGSYRRAVIAYINANYPNPNSVDTVIMAYNPEGNIFHRKQVPLKLGKPFDSDDFLHIFYNGLFRGSICFDGNWQTGRVIGVKPVQPLVGAYRITPHGILPDSIAPLDKYLKILQKSDKLNLVPRVRKYEKELFPGFPITEEGTRQVAEQLIGYVKHNFRTDP